MTARTQPGSSNRRRAPQPKSLPALLLPALLLAAKTRLEAAKAEYDALADRARAELAMGRHVDGDADVLISPNRQWNRAKAFESFGEEICSMQIDLNKAKSVMTGAEFESFYVEGPPRVVVKDTAKDLED